MDKIERGQNNEKPLVDVHKMYTRRYILDCLLKETSLSEEDCKIAYMTLDGSDEETYPKQSDIIRWMKRVRSKFASIDQMKVLQEMNDYLIFKIDHSHFLNRADGIFREVDSPVNKGKNHNNNISWLSEDFQNNLEKFRKYLDKYKSEVYGMEDVSQFEEMFEDLDDFHDKITGKKNAFQIINYEVSYCCNKFEKIFV